MGTKTIRKTSVRHKIPTHAHSITYLTGVWLLKPEVFYQWTRPEGHTLYFKDTHFQPSVVWPLEVHRKPTNNPTKTALHPQGQLHTKTSQPFHHSAHTSAHLISCVGVATPPNHTPTTPSWPFLLPHNTSGVAYSLPLSVIHVTN